MTASSGQRSTALSPFLAESAHNYRKLRPR
jgi:hypothetical protein